MTTPTKSGTQYLINNTTVNDQLSSDATVFSDGSYLVVWQSGRAYSVSWAASGYGIYGQKYNANGTLSGGEFLINSVVDSDETSPAIDTLAGGGYVVTWTSKLPDQTVGFAGTGVYAQQYNADGTTHGGAFLVNTIVNDNQFDSDITALGSGGYVVTWTNSGNGDKNVYGQRYEADGTRAGGQFQLNTHSAISESETQITEMIDGGFLAVWSSQLVGDHDIYAQRYNADGSKLGGEFVVNSFTGEIETDPSIALLNGGGYVVTWTSTQHGPGSSGDVYGQRYNVDGTTSGNEFLINPPSSRDQKFSTVAALEDGGFVVTWTSWFQDGSGWGLYGQRFDEGGLTVGSEFQINTYTNSNQQKAHLVSLGSNSFLVTWEGKGTQDTSGVYGQKYTFTTALGTNSPPTITSTNALTIFENETAVTTVVGTDPNGHTLTWSISGGVDGTLFNIDTTTGDLSFKVAPNFEAFADTNGVNLYEVEVTADDGNGGTDAKLLAVSIRDVYESITGTAAVDSLTGTEFADNMFGLDSNDTMRGLAGNDNIDGGAGADVLYGEDGDDRLDGGSIITSEVDVLYGGTGNDTYIVNSTSDFLDIVFEGGSFPAGVSDVDTIISKGSFFWDFFDVGEILTIDSFTPEGATFISGKGDSTMNGNNVGNFLFTYGGSNVVNPGQGIDVIGLGLFGLDASFNGVNTVKFKPGDDTNYIYDFESGIDKIDTSAYGRFADGAQMLANVVDATWGSFVWMGPHNGADEFIGIIGLQKADLDVVDFVI